MSDKPDIHHRRSIRLRGYDYSQAGAYFITLCTHNRRCFWGDIVDGQMRLSSAGQMVTQHWQDIPAHFPQVELDEFVVMPNHVHGIVMITPVGAQFIAPSSPNIPNMDAMNTGAMNQGAMNRAPTIGGASRDMGVLNRARTLGEIVRAFKAVVTRGLRQSGLSEFAWQRNYYEHIIRNEQDLMRIRQYIINNPLQWALDRENPTNALIQGEL